MKINHIVRLGLFAAIAMTSTAAPRLKISDNHRFLVDEDGRPFFYLGDTAWELFHRLNREEADHYLENRAKKGFTVIQAVALAELNGLNTPNAYGHRPFIDNDPTKPDVKDGPGNDYWDQVDYIVNQAESLGLYTGFLPTWGDKWQGRGTAPALFNPQNAAIYGEWIGRRYQDKPVIWILGGDRTVDNDEQRATLVALAAGLRQGDGGTHLITFHPRGGKSSSVWFQKTDWLDFNMIQSGHSPQSLNYIPIERDYALEPPKPTFDGEPAYEYPPDHLPAKRPVGAVQVRRNAYWAVFAGAHGHTYGTHPIWQMYDQGRKPLWDVVTPWHQALDLPGATQLIHLKRLMLSRPYLTRIPDQSVIISAVPEGLGRIQVTRDGRVGQNDASYLLVYFPQDHRGMLNTGRIGAPRLNVWWFNPRNGEATRVGERPNAKTMEFEPPTRTPGDDWVLVLDDVAKNFPPPGQEN
ncbi:MAG: glycoside hydrolase family 140 protein [Verrucomicrobia bacterium]|nr:glycoside hydrolase family 140 protein [Verrucomicrobiota bacterium]